MAIIRSARTGRPPESGRNGAATAGAAANVARPIPLRVALVAMLASVVIATLSTDGNASAAERSFADWPQSPLPLRILRRPVRDVFADIAEQLDLTLDLSPGVDGIVVSPPKDLSAGRLVVWLQNEFDLVCFYDGVALHVSTKAESAAALIDLKGVGRQRLIETLDEMELNDGRFIAADGPDAGMLMIGGPPAYRLAVERIVEMLASRQARTPVVYRGSSQE
ncbi:MAG: hypothetical protein H6851_01510 [Geminicoccaceae bacterium]|nr:hypothetical protein [Geminicoccaceae bacterium]MCB9942287.1 hypothetical protein [Geminicoccaceae bacterium]